MLNIRVICIGKLKEKYWDAACEEYIKRLGSYCSLEIVELKEDRLPANPSPADEQKVIENEGASILAKIKKSDFVIALDIKGREHSSEELAERIKNTAFTHDTIDFIIGGSLGLSGDVKSRADLALSFGKITLPHQLARVVLLEQIYRAFKINAGETYHK